MCLYQAMMTLHFLNELIYTKIYNYVITELLSKLINRILGLRLLISRSLPGKALRMFVDRAFYIFQQLMLLKFFLTDSLLNSVDEG